MNHSRYVILLVVAALAGCAGSQEAAVFVTRTSFGLDFDAAPTTATFGYNRAEGYLGPRYDTGTVPAVAGSFHTDGGLLKRKIKQTYATGDAALNATAGNGAASTPEVQHFSSDRKAMFFGTSTIFGAGMGFGDAGTTSFTIGLKRKEVSVIPVTDKESSMGTKADGTTEKVVHKFPSVFARFDNTTEASAQADAQLDIHQFFATGIAAQRLASNDSVRKQFRDEATDPKTAAKIEYRDEEHKQSGMVLNSLYCVSKVADAELPKVFGNAQALGVFTDRQAWTDIQAARTPQAARAVYTGHLGLLDPANKNTTTLIELHSKFVCALPGARA